MKYKYISDGMFYETYDLCKKQNKTLYSINRIKNRYFNMTVIG